MDSVETKMFENSGKEQEIDLIELVRKLWKKRNFLIKCFLVAVFIGLVIAFSIPKAYTTTVTLTPEMSNSSKKMGGLEGLVAMAGVDLNSPTAMDAISPTLYPDVVKSTPFLLELFSVMVKSRKGALDTSLYEYLNNYQKVAWWSYIVSAPLKGLGWVLNLFTEEEPSFFTEEEKSGGDVGPFHLTKEQENVVKALQENISVSVDKVTFVISVSTRMQDPLVSAQIANVVVDNLQKYIITYRTQKARQDLVFTQKVYTEARDAYYKAQKAYAAFGDTNKNIISATYRTEQDRLYNEMILTFNVFNTLAQKQEQGKLKLQEETPVYTVIEPAIVPLRVSSPKKSMILVGCVFLGLLIGIGYVVIKDLLFEITE